MTNVIYFQLYNYEVDIIYRQLQQHKSSFKATTVFPGTSMFPVTAVSPLQQTAALECLDESVYAFLSQLLVFVFWMFVLLIPLILSLPKFQLQ